MARIRMCEIEKEGASNVRSPACEAADMPTTIPQAAPGRVLT